MNDELERLRREVDKLTADLAEQKERYGSILTAYHRLVWKDVTAADLEAARTNGVTLQHFIDQLRGGGKTDA